jgi:hypothetical protein
VTFLRQFLTELVLSPEEMDKLRKKYYDREQGGIGFSGGVDFVPYQGTQPPGAGPTHVASNEPTPGGRAPDPAVASPAPNAAITSAPTTGAPLMSDDPKVTQGITGNYSGFVTDPHGFLSGNNKPINDNVIRWLNKAGESMPGWHAEIAVGPSQHTYGTYTTGAPSQVPRGQAADIYLVDPTGRHLPHPVDTSNDPDFGPYKTLGDAYIKASGGQGRWGGYYGRPDRMQYGTVTPEYPRGENAPPQLYTDSQKAGDLTMAQNTQTPNPNVKPTQVASNDPNFVPGQSDYQFADWNDAPSPWKQGISHPERNNPGNLRVGPNDWTGKTTQPGSPFESFDTMENGLRARAITYGSYLNRGINTINQISNTSGPASDGNNIASQNQIYQKILGGKYAASGGENLPIEYTPDNIRRLTAAGISIENGGQGRYIPQGTSIDMINGVVNNLYREGRFPQSSAPSSTPPMTTASNTPPPSTSPTPPPGTTSGQPLPQTAQATPPPNTTPPPNAPPDQKMAQAAPIPGVPQTATESFQRPLISLLRPSKY